MELTDKDLDQFTNSELQTDDLKRYSKYGDFVTEFTANMPVVGYNDTIIELKALIRKQALDSLNEIWRLRKEKPIAVQFWEDSGKIKDMSYITFGWYAWTDKKA